LSNNVIEALLKLICKQKRIYLQINSFE